MSKQLLRMKYHPAKKEVKFERFQSGKEIPIRSDSTLMRYMNMRGSFVLQDHGNEFFDDIATAFDGEKIVNIEVITTKADFEDFEQMIEFFNEEGKCTINATLLAELPDMHKTYSTVKKHGEDAVAVLTKHKSGLWDVSSNNEYVKSSIQKFVEDFQHEIKNINDKIKSMQENSVNLCFSGVYSAGKSALINAILGYAILPENVKSETARMFIIESPKAGEDIRISFAIKNDYSEIVWNEAKSFFEFVAGPTESDSRRLVQEVIEQNKDKLQHRQLNEILKKLNEDSNISTDIQIYFPIPIDNDNVKFKIYDTPGTDSNYGEHQLVLQEALSEQTHSILIFVAAPTKLEGEGNKALLKYLSEAESKDSKTSIDIGRSLFVINWADSITGDDRNTLRGAEIKCKTDEEDESFSIKLSDKKLFFTSAKYAYVAKTVMNNIADKGDEFSYNSQLPASLDKEFGRYYQQNHCATSELNTKKMIDKCNMALSAAEEKGDISQEYYICSGLYALEEEIKTYGEKYAAAVRAYAIIDSVDKAFASMTATANSLNNENEKEIANISSEIESLRDTITSQIDETYRKYAIKKGDAMPDNVLRELQLDPETLKNRIIAEPRDRVEKILKKWFLGLLGKVRANDRDKDKIRGIVTEVLDDFTNNFLNKRQRFFEKTRDSFITDIKEIIKNNGKLSPAAKQYICEIKIPEIKKIKISDEFETIYDNRKRIGGLRSNKEYLDKEGYLQELEDYLLKISTDMSTEYADEFKNGLDSILEKVKSEFELNMENYSVQLQAKMADKQTMEKLGEKIKASANELKNCQDKLNQLIWEVEKDGQ